MRVTGARHTQQSLTTRARQMEVPPTEPAPALGRDTHRSAPDQYWDPQKRTRPVRDPQNAPQQYHTRCTLGGPVGRKRAIKHILFKSAARLPAPRLGPARARAWLGIGAASPFTCVTDVASSGMSRSRVSNVSGSRWLRGWISLAAVLVVTLSGASTADAASAAAPAPTCRDARVWPYNTSSIWNMPIGAAAAYAPAGIFPGPAAPKDGVFIDEDYFVETVWGDPTIDWYSQGHWNSTPDCEQFPWSPLVGRVPWPQNLTITIPGNNALALLQPDGDSLLFTQPAYRCTVDAPLLSIHDTWHMTGSLRYSDGNWGGHGVLLARVATCACRARPPPRRDAGGSALNAIGGSLRLGELLPTSGGPPTHTLKLQLWAKYYYFGAEFGACCAEC